MGNGDPPQVECFTLVELLRMRAQEKPDELLYSFLGNREEESAQLTYTELDCQARALGNVLQKHNAQGERILLLYPPGLEFIAAFFGCLYAGAVAVPAYPPYLNRNLSRLQVIVADAQAAVALTTSKILQGMEPFLREVPLLKNLHWLATDKIVDATTENDWKEPAVVGDTLALLQYTSGSTAKPKGVMLSHGNLLHNSSLIYCSFECSPEHRGVSWLPPYHDMGLIGGILQPLYGGGPTILMSPLSFLQRPLRWLQAISNCKGRATISGGPDFAYELCARKIKPEQKATLDLSDWSVAFIGAEPIREETLRRFAEAFKACGFRPESFYPCYGLAEATLMVSGGLKAAPPVVKMFDATALENNQVVEVFDDNNRVLVGCGTAMPDQEIRIVNPDSRGQRAPNEVGEVWVSGPSVARGYWNQPEESESTFRARLAGSSGEGPYLRTGDLGFLQDAELFITGRLKDLIIIDGRNHYPQDIELTVEQSHPAIRPGGCVAFSVDLDNREQLVILAEVERHYRDLNRAETIDTVRQAVAENHDLRTYAVCLLKTGSIPKTSSGKIQRHACRTNFLTGDWDKEE